MGLGEIPIAVAEISKNAYDQMLDEFDERTATAREKQLAEWHQFDAELQTLLAEGLDPSIAAERNKEFIEKMLPDIELTAEKIIPPKEVEKASEFYLEAMRNTQDIVADTLVNGFDEGVDGMLKSFADMLYKMAAQAAAAKIGELLFSGLAGMGGFFGNLFGGFFESGGFIAPGQFGVVGESGPEIVMGGRTGQTVVPMQPAAAQPVVNLRNINAFDTDVIRDYLLSAQGEQVMLNFIQRNGSRVRAASVGR
jgi:hypothetical protein